MRVLAKRREDTLQRELARVQKSADRLMTAYQEDLLSSPMICDVECLSFGKREQAIGGELSAIQSQLADRAGYLRLAENDHKLSCAATRDREDVRCFRMRQRIVRLLVKGISGLQ